MIVLDGKLEIQENISKGVYGLEEWSGRVAERAARPPTVADQQREALCIHLSSFIKDGPGT